ncbi:MAG: hypothetical protein LBH81_01085 [Rickettsiales bacterium]|jgi:hypothetical protein|nr:hypothetical protein [Rickettsiales bacterium]
MLSSAMAAPIAGPGPAIAGGGGNLTSLKGSGIVNANAYNNQAMPQRTAHVEMAEAAAGAEINYRNCESMLKRCVVPKCSAGCTDNAMTTSIIKGCLSAMSPGCEKFDELPSALAAEIVSMGVAAQQKAASEAASAAAAQAQAQASADTAAMQQQMAQMQQQMAEQQAQAAAAQQKMMEDMMAAQQAQAQQAAAMPAAAPVMAEVLARDQASGQIMSEIDRMNGALASLKKIMETTFDYAGCDYRGENCQQVRRVAAFREKANKFFQPFDEVIDRIYDVISMGQALGADVNNVYMLLESSCERWGLYTNTNFKPNTTNVPKQGDLIRILNSGEEVLNEFSQGQQRSDGLMVACASKSATSNVGMIARRRANATAIDTEPLRQALAAMDRREMNASKSMVWVHPCCGSSTVKTVCKEKWGDTDKNNPGDGSCKEVNPEFTICPVHALNGPMCSSGVQTLSLTAPDAELLARRASNITREMFQQFNRLDIIAKQIRTIVQQAVLNHQNQQAAEAANPGANAIDSALCMSAGGTLEVLKCLGNEVAQLISEVQSASTVSNFRKRCDNLYARVKNETSLYAKNQNKNIKQCGTDKASMQESLYSFRNALTEASNSTDLKKDATQFVIQASPQ